MDRALKGLDKLTVAAEAHTRRWSQQLLPDLLALLSSAAAILDRLPLLALLALISSAAAILDRLPVSSTFSREAASLYCVAPYQFAPAASLSPSSLCSLSFPCSVPSPSLALLPLLPLLCSLSFPCSVPSPSLALFPLLPLLCSLSFPCSVPSPSLALFPLLPLLCSLSCPCSPPVLPRGGMFDRKTG
ncbi:unnamed protein product [Closterium sp. NIES-54]